MKLLLFEDLQGIRSRMMMQSFIDTTSGVPGDDYDVPLPGDLAVPLRDRNPRFRNGVTGEMIADDMRRWLQVGECYYVSPHMMDLAVAASATMPDENIYASDAPSTHGFMWMPQPMRFMDIRGRVLSCSAVLWAAMGDGCVLWWFSDKDDPIDMVNIDMKRRFTAEEIVAFPKLTLAAQASFRWGRPLPRTLTNATLIPNAAQADIHWDGDNLIFRTTEFLPLDVQVKRDPLMAMLLVIWRLMQQTLTSVQRERTDRGTWRHAKRVKFRDHEVTVIALRRRAPSSEHGETTVEWSHQWIVRGHWRKQPCKVEGEWTHRVIWISPFLKGPEDAPLLIRDRVNALIR
jgi:hypothetical protein